MNVEELQQWSKERDEAVLSFDVEKFKAFYLKWQKLGAFKERPLPGDKAIETSMCLIALTLSKATPEQKEKAEKWLDEHKDDPDSLGKGKQV